MSTELNINITGDGDNNAGGVPSKADLESTFGIELSQAASEAGESFGEAVEKQLGRMTASSKALTGMPSDVKDEAAKRLERKEREKEIDRAMRAMDAEYDAEQARLDEDRQRRREYRYDTQQDRDEKYAARQERMDEKRAEAEDARQQRQQDRDEDYAARQERQDQKAAEREQRAAQKETEREQRQAKQAEEKEARDLAHLVAQGGAAIGGTTGRMMGVASQVMGSPAAMQAIFGGGGGGAAGGGAMATGAAGGAGGAVAGAGAVAGMAAAVPILGAVLAVAEIVAEDVRKRGEFYGSVVRAGSDASRATLSGDVNQRIDFAVQGFGKLADKAAEASPGLSLIAPSAKEAVFGINELRNSVKSAAERLSQYDGRLAGQLAQQEVVEIMRDYNRANRLGGRLEAVNERRFGVEQKIQDIADRFMPTMLKFAEASFRQLELILTALESLLVATARNADIALTAAEIVPEIAVSIEALRLAGFDIRGLIRDWRASSSGDDSNAAWENFLALGRGVGAGGPSTINPMGPAPGPVVGAP